MKKEIKEERFEFLLYINGKIICQRYFDIRGYNSETLHSKQLFLLTDAITSRLKLDLKEKSEKFLWEMHNPYKAQTQEDLDYKRKRRTERPPKDYNYEFRIQVDGRCVAQSLIDANIYPTGSWVGDIYYPGVRHNVDIKDIIPTIIREIRDVMTSGEYKGVNSNYKVYQEEIKSLKEASSDFTTYLI